MQRPLLLTFLILLVYFTSLLGVQSAEAQDSTNLENSELILINQSQMLQSGSLIAGYSFHDSPFFKYRVESYTQLGYSFGSLVDVFSENMNLSESGDQWYWEIPIDFSQDSCSCRIHIFQIDYAFHTLASATLSAWISDDADVDESIFIPVVIPESNDFFTDDGSLIAFSSEINLIANVYYPFDSMVIEDEIGDYTSVSIFDHSSSELSSDEVQMEIEIIPGTNEIGKKIMFSLLLNTEPSSNLSDGNYWIEFNDGIYSTWNLKYFFEVDVTSPVVVIDGEINVDECLEWVLINATSSHDPLLEYDFDTNAQISYIWMFEDPDGTLSVLGESMFLSPSSVRFLPVKSGEYEFTVLVRDEAGNEAHSTHIVTVNNVAPEAIISDKNGVILESEEFDYNVTDNELFLSAELSMDSNNDIDEMQYGWYLDGVLYSSENSTLINLQNLKETVELELIVKDLDGGSDNLILILNKLDSQNTAENEFKSNNSDFLNGLNLVLLSVFLCTLVLLIIRKKSTEVDPLPKWSKHNKKQ